MIRIDREMCNLCGNCVAICHTACMSVSGDELVIDHPLRAAFDWYGDLFYRWLDD